MTPPAITPVFVADLSVEGERMPVYVHVIEHPDARVLVDTGMTELHPAMAEMDPRLRPLSEQDFDLAGIDIVVNTHLHADHCGGSASSTSRPPKAGSGSLRSTPSSSGSRTSTSRGDPAPTKASHRRGRMSTERLDRTTGNGEGAGTARASGRDRGSTPRATSWASSRFSKASSWRAARRRFGAARCSPGSAASSRPERRRARTRRAPLGYTPCSAGSTSQPRRYGGSSPR